MIEAIVDKLGLPIAGTELAKPSMGSLIFIPYIPEGSSIQDLGILVSENGSGPVSYDPDTHTGIKRSETDLQIKHAYSGVQIKLPGRGLNILVTRAKVWEIYAPSEVKHVPVDLPAFEISYRDYNGDGDLDTLSFVCGGSIPSLTLSGIGWFALRSD